MTRYYYWIIVVVVVEDTHDVGEGLATTRWCEVLECHTDMRDLE